MAATAQSDQDKESMFDKQAAVATVIRKNKSSSEGSADRSYKCHIRWRDQCDKLKATISNGTEWSTIRGVTG